ncbi:LysM peptidoglycan-binding domain-containing protein [Salinicoccus roseus]|uniref:LysM peptidoglycan-binding domain-containing protein n=1 Tax=Salinicoccus roseus TaxID=45670 RepID=UPI001CA61B61|nr:LysM peptidoglycan-binding domain-containing protein [Salinicoccus roseus]MBY8909984.1 LysM peptidoglycan-binding domain-containing protein [Salinicoccus roseus]
MKKVLSVGAAIAVSGTLAYSAEAASHTVDKGDTLSQIAHENNTTVDAIKAENNLSSNLILPGQVLEVSNEENTEAPAEDGIYKIKSGDTLFEIAQQFDVTVSDLKAWNNLSSDLIFAGKTLAVSGNSVEQAPVVEAPQVEETQEVQQTEQVNQAPAQPSEEVQEQRAAEQAAQEQRAAEQAAQEQRAAEQAAQEQRAAEQAAAEQRAAEQAAQEREQRNQAQAQNQSTSTSSNASGQNWGALAQCESSGNASVVSSNGLYHGLYQFDVQTWRSVGGSGLPSQASAAEQTKRAQILFDQRGAQPWPVCGSRL